MSSHRFWATQFRRLLHGAASWLLATIRRWLARLMVPHRQLGTLALHLASSHPGEPLWHLLAARSGRS